MRSSTKQSINVAIIGAGISGLASGKLLHDQGVGVTVFEKSRGVGGRMATRRLNEENSTFDREGFEETEKETSENDKT